MIANILVSTAQLKQTNKSKSGEIMKESPNLKKILTRNELAEAKKTAHTTVTATTATHMTAEKLVGILLIRLAGNGTMDERII